MQPLGLAFLRSVRLVFVRFDQIRLDPIRLDQGGRGAFEFLTDDAGGERFEVGVGGPAAGKLNERVPAAGERKFENEADDSVVVVLDLALEALSAVEDEGLERFLDGRTLVADVSGSLMLEAGLGGAGSEDVAELVEADLFADVELDQDQDGAAEGRGGF